MNLKSTVHGWTLFFLGALIVPLAGFGERDAAGAKHSENARQTLARTAIYLWGKQSPDGSWRSETYGLLKYGQSFTPFVLFALSEIPSGVATPPDGAIERAMNFLRRMGNEEGFHGRTDPDVLDYPNYATAYALRCFLRYGKKDDKKRIEKMTEYLLGQQFSEVTGFNPDSPVYGGWGFGINHRPTLSSFVDLSHTRRVLAALAAANKVDAKTKGKAKRFLSLLQKNPNEKRSPLIPTTKAIASGFISPPYDGGFFSSPNVSYANKGRLAKDPFTGRSYYRSYATATCDGVLALLALGVPKTDNRVLDAIRWLERHSSWKRPPGIPPEHSEPWDESMIYYHCATRSEVFNKLAIAGDWNQALHAFLSERQSEDGSFVNLHGRLMKEDDPILCSTLALIALSNAVKESG
ncbi:MAG: terpene cyclase/mutase family protein [Opitutae bacterium]|nr:terpene cyclase/mutase family protein [Opitutae bacterium]MBT6852057.1 terpene cyclase/mutase family protein [Opitutae bacterium]